MKYRTKVALQPVQAVLMLVLVVLVLFSPAGALPVAAFDIVLGPPSVGQGEVSLLTIKKGRELKPEVTWREKRIAVVLNSLNGTWSSFLGADLTTVPGKYTLTITYRDEVFVRQVNVVEKDHGIRRFRVPKEMEALEPPTLKRVRQESKKMREIFSRSSRQPLWQGRWIRPLPGKVVSPFGCKTIINNLERSPHSGVDLRAPHGTPIRAPNRGRVVLAEDHFFGGLSMVIDHGGQIHSMYFHLSDASVAVGKVVEKGEIIGFSGSSGRTTGPHLHFGIRLNGNRVNPLGLIELSAGLEEE